MREIDLLPQFVIVMGGAGSGKNHFIQSNPVISQYTLVDVDAIKAKIGINAAIKQLKPMMQEAFESRENVVHPTTGGNLVGQQNKIALAHQYRYFVTLILVDTPVETAIRRVRERVRAGGHDVELAAIVASNQKARENFNILAPMVDKHEIV